MLSGRNSVGGGGIDDEASVLGGGAEVDVVDSNTRTADDPETASGGLEYFTGDLGATTDDEGVTEGDLGAELLRGEVVRAVDVCVGLE